MRKVKAEGGWGVICTEYCSIHPSSDDMAHPYASLWDDSDVRAHRLMTDAVHEHGALAGVELWYGGARSGNLFSRMPALDMESYPNLVGHPVQTRAMDRTDIADLRRWHRKAAIRAHARRVVRFFLQALETGHPRREARRVAELFGTLERDTAYDHKSERSRRS
jgi:dimethylamine/trimethylamine dehydrogenase